MAQQNDLSPATPPTTSLDHSTKPFDDQDKHSDRIDSPTHHVHHVLPLLETSQSSPYSPLPSASPLDASAHRPPPIYRVYKRRFFGLVHLSLLNIIVSWCWLTFAAVSTTSSEFFGVSESAINWLSTGFLFAFVVASPGALYALNRGVKLSMIIAGVLLLLGAWLRYAGTRLQQRNGNGFGLVVFGQVIIGLAQPLVLSAPTRFSNEWFTERGRIAATALASLMNPFGGAVGQLVGPFMATSPERIPDMVLYVAIITTVVAIPTVFLPASPPHPPSASSSPSQHLTLSTLRALVTNPSFHLLAWPFVMFVASFNATSSLLNQILQPYGFSEDEAGLDGAVMILTGLVAAAVASPILDRYPKIRLYAVKLLVLTICACYIGIVYAPRTRHLAGPFVVSALLGAASFIILPLALEILVDVTYPIGPEVSSTICWALSQLFGGILIIAMDALKGGKKGQPEGSMHRSLVLQAVLCWAVFPLPMILGHWKTGRSKRLESTCEEVSEEAEHGIVLQ